MTTTIRIGKRAYRALDMGRTGVILGTAAEVTALDRAGLAGAVGAATAEITDLGRRMLTEGVWNGKGQRVLVVPVDGSDPR
jgi:hypothetical protein